MTEKTSAAPDISGRHRVVIIGGGFGGMAAARALKGSAVDVTLVDRRNFHLFQPLLYQVATGGLSPANIAAPLRGVLGGQRNCRVLLAEVVQFDVANRRVLLAPGAGATSLCYDTLIVAAGARHSYFGHDDWEPYAPGLKTIEDATEIRARILAAFEAAESEQDASRRRELLTFVIVGAGPTGVELAGALAEIARHTLRDEFREIDPSDATILLVEAGPRVLPAFPECLSEAARADMERLGVEVRVGTMVAEIAPERVLLKSGEAEEYVNTTTVLWAAGVQASGLAKKLAEAAGAGVDRAGRIVVEPDLSLRGHPEIFVIGDMACCSGRAGKPLPGVAPVAIQQGQFAARCIRYRVDGPGLWERLTKRGGVPVRFEYRNYGNLATIGRSAAVADFGKLRFTGFTAWVLWLVIHLMKIVSFRNRLLVLVQWGWSYFSFDRSARLITGEERRKLAKPE